MSARLAVLRPAPGNAATAARIEALGLCAIRLPLFEVGPLAWHPPQPSRYDAVLMTSANALRHGGAALAALTALPALAVGDATAAAARAAGFEVALTGTAGIAALLADRRARAFARLLHLAGRETTAPADAALDTFAVYASDPLIIDADRLAALAGTVLLVHSARAAARIGTLLDLHALPRGATALAAISPTVLTAAGPGWRAAAVAAVPNDAALIEAARRLAD